MKKLFMISVAIAFASILANAKTTNDASSLDSERDICVNSSLEVSTEIAANASSARIIYDGPAYSIAPGDSMTAHPGETVSVYWTTEGCSVNGNSGYQPGKVTGDGYPMMINGRVKWMNYYVNYKGERYFFQL